MYDERKLLIAGLILGLGLGFMTGALTCMYMAQLVG